MKVIEYKEVTKYKHMDELLLLSNKLKNYCHKMSINGLTGLTDFHQIKVFLSNEFL